MSTQFCTGCARFAVFLQKYFEFQNLWSLSLVDFFLSQSKSQFQLDFNLRFVVVLDRYITITVVYEYIFKSKFLFINRLLLFVLLHKLIFVQFVFDMFHCSYNQVINFKLTSSEYFHLNGVGLYIFKNNCLTLNQILISQIMK